MFLIYLMKYKNLNEERFSVKENNIEFNVLKNRRTKALDNC